MIFRAYYIPETCVHSVEEQLVSFESMSELVDYYNRSTDMLLYAKEVIDSEIIAQIHSNFRKSIIKYKYRNFYRKFQILSSKYVLSCSISPHY